MGADMKDIFTSTHELCEEYKQHEEKAKRTKFDGSVEHWGASKGAYTMKTNLLGRKEVFIWIMEMLAHDYPLDNSIIQVNKSIKEISRTLVLDDAQESKILDIEDSLK